MKTKYIIAFSLLTFSAYSQKVCDTIKAYEGYNKYDTLNRKQGKWIIYWAESCRVFSISNFKDDVLHGQYTQFYPNGDIQSNLLFYEGKLHGIQLFYKDYGRIIDRIEEYNQGILDGMCMYYNYDGRLLYRLSYANGLLDGVKTTFYPSGRLKYKSIYSAGKRILWESFRDNRRNSLIERKTH